LDTPDLPSENIIPMPLTFPYARAFSQPHAIAREMVVVD